MKIAIWGAGGIGCYYGAKLINAGHDVVFIARGDHLKAMQDQGLSVQHEALSFQQPVTALDQLSWQKQCQCDDFDLIILCLKATVTEQVLAEASDWLKRGKTPLLSLQNGVENEALIAEVVGEARTLGGLAVRIGGHIVQPGVVEAKGVAQIVMGAWPQQDQNSGLANFSANLEQIFNQAQIPTTLSGDIRYELWRKLLINNGVNPLSALTGLDTRTLTSNPVYHKVVYQMMQEAAAAAEVEGVDLTQGDIDEMFQLICNFDAIKTSMLVDREKGRPLELDSICGAVTRRLIDQNQQALVTELVAELLKQGLKA